MDKQLPADSVRRRQLREAVEAVEVRSHYTKAQLARVIVYLARKAAGPSGEGSFSEDVQDCIEWAERAARR